MRLDRCRPRRTAVGALPIASVALLTLALVMLAGMSSASRGPGLRFASLERDGGFSDGSALHVEVLSETEASIEGEPVPQSDLAAEVARRLRGRADAAVVLRVAPDATYQAMVQAYGAIAGIAPPPRIAFPPAFGRTSG